MATSYTCDGIQRRDALKAGLLGVGGLSLSNFLKLSHAGEVSSKAKAKAAIYINLGWPQPHGHL